MLENETSNILLYLYSKNSELSFEVKDSLFVFIRSTPTTEAITQIVIRHH